MAERNLEVKDDDYAAQDSQTPRIVDPTTLPKKYWGKRHAATVEHGKKCNCEELTAPAIDKMESWCPWLPCFQPEDPNVSRAEEPQPKRYIYAGSSWASGNEGYLKQPHRENEEEVNTGFCGNIISTTKYTVASFLPVNLFEQFQKKANFYFLCIACLSFTPLSPKSPVFSVAPLCFVLAVSAVKEAYEDYKRFEMDKEINNREVDVWRPVGDPDRIDVDETNRKEGEEWEWVKLPWQAVEVGDMLRVTKKHRAFPADLVLLQSSTPQGLCNIETSNLDGETNLKIKQAIGATYSLETDEDGDFYCSNPNLDYMLESEAPNEKMDKSSWKGALYLTGKDVDEPLALGFNQLLLRGCTLRNTDWIIGHVIFTGVETKLMLNNKVRAFKRSNVDLVVDKALYVIFATQAVLCIFGSIAHKVWLEEEANSQWYQYVEGNGAAQTNFDDQSFLNYFTFMVLLDLFVPISLYVSMEMVKFVQAWIISNDSSMEYISQEEDEDIRIKAQARTSNLNEELGQIGFIFSDKTGTLTRNKMEFVNCHVNGTCYGPGEMEKQHKYVERVPTPPGLPAFDEKKCRFSDNRLARERKNPVVNDFLTLLSVCHSIIPEYPDEEDDGTDKNPLENIVYQASSPDEKALVVFAKNLHYVFQDSHVQILDFKDKQVDGHRFYVNIFGEVHTFDLYHMLEFTSARKRMSVIVYDPRDKLFKLYCKGADNVVFQRLKQSEKGKKWESCFDSLRSFAAEGLRTLVCGMRVLSEDEYYNWLLKLKKAQATIDNRDALVDECFNQIECELELLGATAIEDRLQDGVPETIANLAVAGISIWVLTGDKVETAINIGRSCKLITPVMSAEEKTLFIIDIDEKLSDADAKKLTEKMFDEAWELMKDQPENNADQGLVISGKGLGYAFPHRKRDAKGKEIPPTEEQIVEETRLQQKLLKICKKCRAVLCCRVSPKQKSQMVALVKQNVTGIITLAIGDGANDVPMIKAAHVGIGISGQEGLQAVMASDYAIGQFCYLQNLLLIHGAWDYRRTSTLILYSFYKNIMFSMTQIWYSFYCGFSGTLFYDAFSGSCYNLVFTALPVLFTAVIDRPYSKDIARYCPELYQNGPNNGSFNLLIFFYYAMEGVVHSLILFFGTTFFIDGQTTGENGQVVGFWVSCTTMFTALVTVATGKMMLETRTWTKWSMLVFGLSEFAWFVFALVWSAFPATWGFGNSNVYNIAQISFELPIFWFAVMFAAVVCLIPEVLLKYTLRMYYPTRLHVIEELESYPELREKFINDIKAHMRKQDMTAARDHEKVHATTEQEHLGFSEFQVDRTSPDYVMSQSQFMRAAGHRRKSKKGIFKKLFQRNKQQQQQTSDNAANTNTSNPTDTTDQQS